MAVHLGWGLTGHEHKGYCGISVFRGRISFFPPVQE